MVCPADPAPGVMAARKALNAPTVSVAVFAPPVTVDALPHGSPLSWFTGTAAAFGQMLATPADVVAIAVPLFPAAEESVSALLPPENVCDASAPVAVTVEEYSGRDDEDGS